MLFDVLLPVFATILIGYIAGKIFKINLKPINTVLLYVTGPFLVFYSLAKADVAATKLLSIGLAVWLIIGILFALLFVFFKITKSKRRFLYISTVFGNTGYIGYPVALFAFGMAGLSEAVIYDMFAALIYFSLGIYFIHKGKNIFEGIKIPLFPAAILGIIFNIFQINIPEVALVPIKFIGDITIPLALIYLGIKLTEIKIKSVNFAVATAVAKISLGFVIAFAVTYFLGFTGMTKTIIILQAAMPCGILTTVLTDKYEQDPEIAATAVLISTILSIFTIPLILHFF